MRAIRIYLFTTFLCTLILALGYATIAPAQEKEKPKTTADAWRQALPPEAQVLSQVEDSSDSSQLTSDETKKTLLALERTWMDSLKVGDADTLSGIISTGFMFANPRAMEVNDRARYLQYGLSELKLTSYEFDKTTIHLFGRVAIVCGVLKQKATVRGEDWGGNYLVTDVWINREGSWRVVSRHESRIQDQK